MIWEILLEGQSRLHMRLLIKEHAISLIHIPLNNAETQLLDIRVTFVEIRNKFNV
jgi:hypothetical protein